MSSESSSGAAAPEAREVIHTGTVTLPTITGKDLSSTSGIAVDSTVPELDEETAKLATSLLLSQIPAVARGITIKPAEGEEYTILNFLVASEPIKQEDGSTCYGFVRCLGCAKNVEEATDKATKIVSKDSTSRILICETGRYTKLAKSAVSVKEMVDVSEDPAGKNPYTLAAKRKQLDDEEQARILRDRMKEIREKADDDDVADLKFYAKRCKVLCSLLDTKKKLLQDLKDKDELIYKAIYAIKRLDKEYPEHKDNWIDLINSTYKERGIRVTFEPPEEFYTELKVDVGELPLFNEDEVRGYTIPKQKPKVPVLTEDIPKEGGSGGGAAEVKSSV